MHCRSPTALSTRSRPSRRLRWRKAGLRKSAWRCLRVGLGLWRGPPLAELADYPFAAAEIGRLEELRLALLKRRIDAELELGQHAEVVAELEKLVATHRLDERLRGQLMVALYQSRPAGGRAGGLPRGSPCLDGRARARAGRGAAVARAADPRARPHAPAAASASARSGKGPHRRITPASAAAASSPRRRAARGGSAPGRRASPPRERRSRSAARRPGQLDRGRRSRSRDRCGSDSRGPRAGERCRRCGRRVGGERRRSHALAARPGDASRDQDGSGYGFEPTDLAADSEHVWVAGGYDHVLWRLDRDGVARLKLRFTERLGPLPSKFARGRAGVAVGGTSAWLAHGDEVTELDPVTGAIRRTVPAGGNMAAGDRCDAPVGLGRSQRRGPPRRRGGSERGDRHDRRRNRPYVRAHQARLQYERNPVASNTLWVAIRVTGTVWQLDPATRLLQRTLPVGNEPRGTRLPRQLALGHERAGRDAATESTRATARPRSIIPIGHALEEVASAGGSLFVAVRGP